MLGVGEGERVCISNMGFELVLDHVGKDLALAADGMADVVCVVRLDGVVPDQMFGIVVDKAALGVGKMNDLVCVGRTEDVVRI